MDMSSTIRRGHPAAFGVFIVLSLIVAIIASAVAADLNKQDDGQGGYGTNLVRDTTRFMVFTGWWSFLVGVIFVRIRYWFSLVGILTHAACSVLDGHRRCHFIYCCPRSYLVRDVDLLAVRFGCAFERCGQQELLGPRCS